MIEKEGRADSPRRGPRATNSSNPLGEALRRIHIPSHRGGTLRRASPTELPEVRTARSARRAMINSSRARRAERLRRAEGESHNPLCRNCLRILHATPPRAAGTLAPTRMGTTPQEWSPKVRLMCPKIHKPLKADGSVAPPPLARVGSPARAQERRQRGWHRQTRQSAHAPPLVRDTPPWKTATTSAPSRSCWATAT